MPAIEPGFLNCTVYLYPSEEAAESGKRVGGSGFVVAIESRHKDLTPYLSVVTNRHVINTGNRFVRFKGRDGDAVVMKTNPEDWLVSADDDLAVMSFGIPKEIEWYAIGSDILLDESCEIDQWPVYPGDEVFFCGRFIAFDGTQKNKPVMRFGNISMLPDPDAPVNVDGQSQVAFLVECRSQGGFSGSPAFVNLEGTRLLPRNHEIAGRLPKTFKLLGVVCGHLPVWSPVCEQRDTSSRIPDQWVDTNSGIAVVIPAWRLLKLLESDVLVLEREEAERRRDARKAVST